MQSENHPTKCFQACALDQRIIEILIDTQKGLLLTTTCGRSCKPTTFLETQCRRTETIEIKAFIRNSACSDLHDIDKIMQEVNPREAAEECCHFSLIAPSIATQDIECSV